MDTSFATVMSQKNEILKRGTGIDYQEYEISRIAFNYEGLMASPRYSLMDVQRILKETGVGNTPLVELKNLTELVRSVSPPGKGCRIFIKDEAANPSGSFKDRRAGLSIYHAAKLGTRVSWRPVPKLRRCGCLPRLPSTDSRPLSFRRFMIAARSDNRDIEKTRAVRPMEQRLAAHRRA
jgi:hypothetical protein